MDQTTSFYSPDYTYAFDKYSCVREMWFWHIAMAYCIFITGLVCFATRIFDRLKWMHKWSGRLYIVSMLWCTATSLLIHNDGLPLGVLYSFVWVLVGMCLGWFLINIHQIKINREAAKRVQESIKLNGAPADLLDAIEKEKGVILNAKTIGQRIFSLKALHGMFMFTSWYNIAGRIFASNQSGDFTCHTYPAYKGFDFPEFPGAGKPLTLVPVHNPRYYKLPWAYSEGRWALISLFGPIIFSLVVGVSFAFASIKFNKNAAKVPSNGAVDSQVL